MKAQCIICSDLFDTNSDVSATHCGHTFHQVCLLRWIDQSSSCPQCRQKVTKRNIIMKLFFDIASEDSQQQDPDTLQNKMSELQSQLLVAHKEKRDMQEELNKLHDTTCEVQTKFTSAIEALRGEEENSKALKLQLTFFTKRVSELDKVKQEVKALKMKLADLQSLEKVVNENGHDIGKLLETFGDATPAVRSIATMCTLLKKELQTTSDSKKALVNEKAHLQMELNASRKQVRIKERDVARLQLQITELEAEMEHLREEKCSLNKKIFYLQEVILNSPTPKPRSNTSLSRILLESPAPDPKRPRLSDPTMEFKENSKEVEEDICSIISSIGSESLDSGLPEAKSDLRFKVLTYQAAPRSELHREVPRNLPGFMSGYAIFQNKRPSSKDFLQHTTTKPLGSGLSRGLGYDGFGGHSAPQEFPKPRSRLMAVSKTAYKKKTAFVPQPNTLDKFIGLTD